MRPAGSNLLVVVGIDGSGRTHRLVDGTEGRATMALHPDQAGDEVADLLGSARDTDALLLADDAVAFDVTTDAPPSPEGFAGVIITGSGAMVSHLDAWSEATDATDDAQVARAAGLSVATIAGDRSLEKLTYAEDFERAEARLSA